MAARMCSWSRWQTRQLGSTERSVQSAEEVCTSESSINSSPVNISTKKIRYNAVKLQVSIGRAPDAGGGSPKRSTRGTSSVELWPIFGHQCCQAILVSPRVGTLLGLKTVQAQASPFQSALNFCSAEELAIKPTHDESQQLPDSYQQPCSTMNHCSKHVYHLLCLSNGHGEDAVAVAILEELQTLAAEQGKPLHIEALPLVGLGTAYKAAHIPTLGPAKAMPSGGFIYMDRRQLLGDVRAGLLGLLVDQMHSISQWVKRNPEGAVLAVGDVFPLALAWLADSWTTKQAKQKGWTNVFGFVGTAKSEYYLRDDDGKPLKAHKRNIVEAIASPGSVYFPWERALMASSRCRLVAPRDGLTAQTLQEEMSPVLRSKVVDLGNPMMDNLEPRGVLEELQQRHPVDYCLALLPGTRAPEVHANWRLILECVDHTAAALAPKRALFIAPISPSLPLDPFTEALAGEGWRPLAAPDSAPLSSSAWSNGASAETRSASHSEAAAALAQQYQDARLAGSTGEAGEESGCTPVAKQAAESRSPQAPSHAPLLTFSYSGGASSPLEDGGSPVPLLALVRGSFSDCVHAARGAIAMAGTGTEQLVGLGKPAFTIPGRGPQFTEAFAEAQSRLLGKSVILCQDPISLATTVPKVLDNKHLMMEIAMNGRTRMGAAGGSRRIANHIWTRLLDVQLGHALGGP